jgi:hypothetical protein
MLCDTTPSPDYGALWDGAPKDDTVDVPHCTRARRGVVRQRRTSDPAPAEFCVLVS